MYDLRKPHLVNPDGALRAEALYTACDPEQFDFETTDALDDLGHIMGQERATAALRFGLGMQADGYNVFALGSSETNVDQLVLQLLHEQAGHEAPPLDCCYVFNFNQPHKPEVLLLPPGTGTQLQADMARFVDELQTGFSAAFESEEYQTRRQIIEADVQKVHEEAVADLKKKAQERGVALLQTPTGFLFVPTREGEVLSPDEIQQLSEEARSKIEADVENLQERLLHILRQVPMRKRKLRERIRALNQEVARYAVHDLFSELRAKYGSLDQVLAFLEAVEADIVERVGGGLKPNDMAAEEATAPPQRGQRQQVLLRYTVNKLVDHSETQGAPIVCEDHPTLANLIGRVEYVSEMGNRVTDFTLIRPGALHRANGGYLLLDIRKVLLQPYAWEALKRTLRAQEIRIQSLGQTMGFDGSATLEPTPIPLNVKVVLYGERRLYYLLTWYDPDFPELFRVEADFDDQVDRTATMEQEYTRLIGSLARQSGLRPLDRYAVARVIEHSARMAADAEKLSAETCQVRDLLHEADYWAGQHGHDCIVRDDVEQALENRRWCRGRLRERVEENILRNIIFIDTDGEAVGQINGLSVIQLGQDRFGRPSRITARVRLGKGDVIDIEREVDLGGPLHSKGVLIMSSFLASRYAADMPLSLSASLVFEQSYGGVDGDSASAAELFALLSALAEVPLKQSYAVTGSVNQHGRIQPIGGVNEKIEGFFAICRERGLTGTQGVLIPAANIPHLMLRRDVVEAVEQGQFHIYPITTIDEGLERLTGLPMGTLGDEADDSINGRILRRLHQFTDIRRSFLAETDGQGHDHRQA